MHDHTIEALPGSYLLVLESVDHQQIEVGCLGSLQLRPGFYLYVGSAFGPGGVRARVSHHARVAERCRWHIDYLRKVCRLNEIWCSYDSIRREREWVGILEATSRLTIPMTGFGASDHPGKSHLFYCATIPSFAAFSRRAGKQKGELIAPLHKFLIGL